MVHHFAIGIIGVCPSAKPTASSGCPTTSRDSSAGCVGSTAVAVGQAVIDFRSYFFGRFDRASPAHVTQPPMEALVRGRYVV